MLKFRCRNSLYDYVDNLFRPDPQLKKSSSKKVASSCGVLKVFVPLLIELV